MKSPNQDNNKNKKLELIAAQARLYSKAKWWTYPIFIASLAPLAALFLKPYYPGIEDSLSIIGGIGLFLVFVLNREVNKKVKTAALIQEEFDIGAYGWDWNEQLGESEVITDIRKRAAGNFKMPESRLPWYTKKIANVTEPSMRILLCQRENVVWDWQLKKRFGSLLRFIFFFTLVAILIWAPVEPSTSLKDTSLIIWLFVNLLLVLGFLYKNFELWQAFRKVGNSQEQILNDIEAEITSYKKSKAAIPYERLRLLQNRIFQNRKENAVVPDWLFNLSRKVLQNRTSASTNEIIQELNA